MFPIVEHSLNHKRGYLFKDFGGKFEEVLEYLVKSGRGKAFGFMFFDFNNQDMLRITNNKDVISDLDEILGKELSLFYFNIGEDGNKITLEKFNETFLSELGIKEAIPFPCVVFFKYNNKSVSDAEILAVRDDVISSTFDELCDTIESYKQTHMTNGNFLPTVTQHVPSAATGVALGEAFSKLVG